MEGSKTKRNKMIENNSRYNLPVLAKPILPEPANTLFFESMCAINDSACHVFHMGNRSVRTVAPKKRTGFALEPANCIY